MNTLTPSGVNEQQTSIIVIMYSNIYVLFYNKDRSPKKFIFIYYLSTIIYMLIFRWNHIY